jgi:hypothetical protein
VTVTLTAQAEELLRRLAHLSPAEEIIQRALEELTKREAKASRLRMTPAEAVERILELRERNTLGGSPIKELINEGRKY